MLCILDNYDLFLIFTVYPQWPEIRDALLSGQSPQDRPDLVARVFRLRFKHLLADLTEKHTFGPVIGYVYTVGY